MSDETAPTKTVEQLEAELAALRAAIAVLTAPRTLELLGQLARGQRSADELLIVLDANIGRARAASRGYAAVGRYDLAIGERDRVRELSALAAALRSIASTRAE